MNMINKFIRNQKRFIENNTFFVELSASEELYWKNKRLYKHPEFMRYSYTDKDTKFMWYSCYGVWEKIERKIRTSNSLYKLVQKEDLSKRIYICKM